MYILFLEISFFAVVQIPEDSIQFSINFCPDT